MSLHLLRLMIYRAWLRRKKTGGEKRGPQNSEEDGRKGEICPVGKKMAQST
jgi:hypothetical protein